MREPQRSSKTHTQPHLPALLNSNGGQLYIGVNNDGFEVGMHDDFKYFQRHAAMAGPHRHKVSNIDSLCVFIEDLVNQAFGDA